MQSLSTLLSVGGAVIFSSLLSTAQAQTYQLVDTYQGQNFFDQFSFFTDGDPTHGFVQYVNSTYAAAAGLTQAFDDHVTMGVDSTTVFADPNGAGRPSVRLQSLKAYNHGLFVLNATNIPFGCGVWPAFWTLGPNWPFTGEIDILEGVNQNTNNLMTLHTDTGCTIAGADETGTLLNSNCDSSGSDNTGCGVQDASASSYGAGFNAAGGGLYVMEWTSDLIRVWTFTHDEVPASLADGVPDTSQFGTPDANLVGSCDIDQHFQNHNIIFDLTFCGDFAGNVYSSTTCPNAADGLIGCNTYVGNNPGDFAGVHWDINSVLVYQLTGTSTTKEKFEASTLSSVVPLAHKSPALATRLAGPAMGASTTATSTKSSLPVPKPTSVHNRK